MEERISGHTKLHALINSPVGHSGSPAMYNYSFAATNIDAAYLAFDIPLDCVKEGVEALRVYSSNSQRTRTAGLFTLHRAIFP